jgi:O-antigen/teichoic acid export membrane protein
LIAYLTFTNMGMGTASTKFAAEAYARKDESGEAAVVWTSLLITLFPVVAGMLVVMLTAGSIVQDVFGVPSHLKSIAVTAVQLTALGFAARIFAEVFNTPQLVRLRIDLYASLNTGLLLVQHAAVVFALLLGGGLGGAVWMITLCSLLTALTHAFGSRTLLPILFRPRIDLSLVRPLLRFGSALILSALLGFMLTNIERLLLAHFGSVKDLAYYSVAATLASLVAFLPSSINQPLLPALSALHADKEKAQLERLCTQVMRAILLCMLPAAFMLCAIAQPLLRVWAGAEFAEHSTVPLYILMGGVIFNTLATVPYNILTASGRTGTIARCHLLEIIPYIIGAALLTYLFGATGAAIAWSLRTLLDALLLFAAVRHATGISFRVLTGDWQIYGVAILILIGTALLSVSWSVAPYVHVAIATIGCAVYCGVVWTKMLSIEERMCLLRLFRLQSERAS